MSEPQWTFEARITGPSDVVITTSITIPERLSGPDTPELSEIAQMGAVRILSYVKRLAASPKQSAINTDEVPF